MNNFEKKIFIKRFRDFLLKYFPTLLEAIRKRRKAKTRTERKRGKK